MLANTEIPLFAPRRPTLFLLCLAYALRLFQLGAQSLWYDEAVSLLIAQKDPAALIAHTAGDIHPPLYYLLLHYWLQWVGHSEFAAAYFSLIFSMLLIVLSFRLARDLFGFHTGFVSALLISLSAFNLWYAQEVRMYTLVACLALGANASLLHLMRAQAQKTGWRYWLIAAVYALCVAAGLYIHYYLIFLWIAQYGFVTLWLSIRWLREHNDAQKFVPSQRPSTLTLAADASSPSNLNAPPTPSDASSSPSPASHDESTLSDSQSMIATSATGTTFYVSRLDYLAFRLRSRFPILMRFKPLAHALRRIGVRMKPFVARIGKVFLRIAQWLTRLARYPAFLRWQVIQLIIILLFLPWLPTAWRQVTDPPVPPWRSWIDWSHALGEALTALTVGQGFPLWLAWPLVSLLGLIYLLGMARFLTRRSDPAQRWAMLFLSTITFAPLLLILFASSWTPLFHVRYTFIFAAAFYIILALGFTWVGRISMILMAMLLGVFVGGSLYADYLRRIEPVYAKDDYRAAVQFISERIRPGDAVLINAGYTYPTFVYYFAHAIDWRGRLSDYRGDQAPNSLVVAQTGSLDAPPNLGWGSPQSDFYATDETSTARALDLLFSKHARVWQLRANDTVNDPRGFIRQYLKTHTLSFDETTVSGESHVQVQGLVAKRNLNSPIRPTTPLSITFGERVTLLGWTSAPTITAGHALKLSLFWQTLTPLDVDYRASLRLLDARGRLWAQSDSEPAGPLLRMGDWPLRQMIPGTWNLGVPLGVPPGDYQLQVQLYDPFTQKSLPVAGGVEGIRAVMGRIQVVRAASEADKLNSIEPEVKWRSQAVFDNGVALRGYDLIAERVRPGESIHVNLLWLSQQKQSEDQEVFLQLLDERGRLWHSQQSAPIEGRYPTAQWIADEYVSDFQSLTIPQDVPDGTYRVLVGWMRPREREKIPVRDGWWPLRSDSLELGRVEVKGRERLLKTPALINNPMRVRFGDFAQLIGYDVSSVPLTATRSLTLTLYWQATGRTNVSYKVFTHLVGANEQIVAQRDQEPGAGTLPTTSWVEGEYLIDRYVIDFPTELANGDYALYLGLYNPRTNTRVNIVDAANQPAGDRWQLSRWANSRLVR